MKIICIFAKIYIFNKMEEIIEIWKDIPNYEGIYQASNLGRVKSFYGLKERILKPLINHRGYYGVQLYKQSVGKFYQVHRLVWEAFNGKIPEGLQVNHINEIKTDNRLSNLNLMTCKENINYGTGVERRAKSKSKSVLQFTLDNILVKEYPSTHQIERETGFAQSNISKCCKGKRKQAYGYKWKYKE